MNPFHKIEDLGRCRLVTMWCLPSFVKFEIQREDRTEETWFTTDAKLAEKTYDAFTSLVEHKDAHGRVIQQRTVYNWIN